MSRARRKRSAKPPITPPTIAPVGTLLELVEELEELVGRASVGGTI